MAAGCAQPEPLRIVSYNLASLNHSKYWPSDSHRAALLRDRILAENPDVICLQESLLSSLDEFGYSNGGTAQCVSHAGDCWVFSRLPILKSFNIETSDDLYNFPVHVLDVTSRFGETTLPLAICSIHLFPHRGDKAYSAIRRKQAKQIVEQVQQRAPECLGRLLIIGDTNMQPDEDLSSLGMADGYLKFKNEMPDHRRANVHVRSVVDGVDQVTAVRVEGHEMLLTSLANNAALAKALETPTPIMPLRFCRKFRGTSFAAIHNVDACQQLHLKGVDNGEKVEKDDSPAVPKLFALARSNTTWPIPPPPKYCPEDDEHTWDSFRNKLNGAGSSEFVARLDRIFLSKAVCDGTGVADEGANQVGLTVTDFQLIGDTPVVEGNCESYLSDHFGFVACIAAAVAK